MQNMCECGHYFSDHRGIGACKIDKCKCTQYHNVAEKTEHIHVCGVCSREYHCSYEKCRDKEGICNICTKEIENNYPGDLMNTLFGMSDNKADVIKAKKLAMDIKKTGVNIRQLFDYWRTQKDRDQCTLTP